MEVNFTQWCYRLWGPWVICLRATGQRPAKVSIHGHTAAALRLIAHRAQQNAWQAWHIRSFQLWNIGNISFDRWNIQILIKPVLQSKPEGRRNQRNPRLTSMHLNAFQCGISSEMINTLDMKQDFLTFSKLSLPVMPECCDEGLLTCQGCR